MNSESNWQNMSLIEQLGNIGSEVGRAKIAQETEDDRFQGAVKRALELFDRTLSDSRWSDRIDEIKMAKDCLVASTKQSLAIFISSIRSDHRESDNVRSNNSRALLTAPWKRSSSVS